MIAATSETSVSVAEVVSSFRVQDLLDVQREKSRVYEGKVLAAAIRIVEHRLACGQSELARICGISKTAMSRMHAGAPIDQRRAWFYYLALVAALDDGR